jgi:signal transduction histidine kinase
MRVRVLTFRYVGALLVVAGLLVAGQTVIHQVLARQEGDARVINLAGRQRMLGQRLCTLLLALDAGAADPGRDTRGELSRTVDDWEHNQTALQIGRPETGVRVANSDIVHRLFSQIDTDHRAMVSAARAALAQRSGEADPALARTACLHQETFLTGMDHIVAEYEREARDRIVGLRRLELVLLALALLVLGLEGVFVFRPAVRDLRRQLAERALVQRALDVSETENQASLTEIARLERQLLQASDREQLQLAQDLHDGLGQHLIGAAFLLRPLRTALGGGAGGAQLDEVDRLLAEAIDQTRDLVRSLHSPTLEAAGLAAGLADLADHTARVFGVPCHVRDRAGFELPAAWCTHLHRIAREAVINAAKHASATAIEIELGRDADELTLVVRDDGVGIGTPPPAGVGLRLMAYRAKLLGASLQITAHGDRGTTVTCRVPLCELAARGARP